MRARAQPEHIDAPKLVRQRRASAHERVLSECEIALHARRMRARAQPEHIDGAHKNSRLKHRLNRRLLRFRCFFFPFGGLGRFVGDGGRRGFFLRGVALGRGNMALLKLDHDGVVAEVGFGQGDVFVEVVGRRESERDGDLIVAKCVGARRQLADDFARICIDNCGVFRKIIQLKRQFFGGYFVECDVYLADVRLEDFVGYFDVCVYVAIEFEDDERLEFVA